MARGLPVGGELHTIEVDDELEAIAARYFARSGLGDRISHISARRSIWLRRSAYST